MNVDIHAQEHLVRVCLRGPCTLYQAADLHRTLLSLKGETTAILVELDQITALDSAGLQVLLNLRHNCDTVFFCYANSLVQKTVEQLDLYQAFHEEHLESVRPS
jgi:anti-anti-sigma regulatory factor